jgi:integrase
LSGRADYSIHPPLLARPVLLTTNCPLLLAPRQLFRQSLETDAFTTAKLRLPDKLKELRKPKAEVGTFKDGRLKYEAETQNDYTLAPLSKTYRLRCVECLVKTWPGVDKLKVDCIEEADCREWAARYAAHYSPTVFNNTVNTLRRILALAGLGHDANPAMRLERLGMRHKKLELPTSEQFDRLVALIETSGAAQAKDCADLVRFLAFTGCRISEAKQASWADVSWELNELTIHCVKRRLTSSAALTRILPLIPALKQLLERLKTERKPQPGDLAGLLGKEFFKERSGQQMSLDSLLNTECEVQLEHFYGKGVPKAPGGRSKH